MIFTLPHATRPLNKSELNGPPVYLNTFFTKNTLLIEERDFQGITIDNWPDLLEKIKSSINIYKIELIVIDTTLNPIILDTRYSESELCCVEIKDKIKQIIDTIILTGDFRYYYDPVPDVVFFPNFFWVLNTKSIFQHYRRTVTVYDTTIEKSRAVMCLNKNLHWHRMFLFSLIADKTWFHNIGYSFQHKINDRCEQIAVKQHLDQEEIALIKSYDYLLPMLLDIEKTDVDIPLSWSNGASNMKAGLYDTYAVNVVTETSLTEGVLLTEKTCKPFMAYQIPIIVGPQGANKFLEDIGLDMFSDYVPWQSWDNEPDHKRKIIKIVEFLDKILSSATAEQDILAMHQSFYSRLIKNKEYFHSKELENILLSQIRS